LSTSAEGINNRGTDIVGIFTVPRGNGQQLARGFLLKKGVFTTIVVPNTDQTYAIGVNNSGEIVGEFVRTPSSLTESFLYRRGVFSAVSPNSRITQALGVNDAGQIVGVFIDNNGAPHGFVETRGSFVNIDFPGSVSTEVHGINDSGEIVGGWEDTDGGEHGFIGTPVEGVASR
jgi:probable HAF family extracellular repeat protein